MRGVKGGGGRLTKNENMRNCKKAFKNVNKIFSEFIKIKSSKFYKKIIVLKNILIFLF